MRRSQNRFGELEKAALLKALGECRRATLDGARAALLNNKPVESGCKALVQAIDDLAEILTDNREHFWKKAHSSPPTGL